MRIVSIVSGGQTGADRGGLDAAIYCEVPHGGWCPKGRKAEDGRIPAKYEMTEMPTADYLARTEANVVDSDATVIFTNGRLEGGSLKTAQFAKKHRKPCLHVDLDVFNRKAAVTVILQWLKDQCPGNCVLNVAGSRGSKAALLDQAVMIRMVDVLTAVNPECRKFYPLGEEG